MHIHNFAEAVPKGADGAISARQVEKAETTAASPTEKYISEVLTMSKIWKAFREYVAKYGMVFKMW